ncbi:MAG: hypothetical protein ACLGHQ_02595 [Acidimicrobiia bacterium]
MSHDDDQAEVTDAVRAAIVELRSIRSTDPCAAIAVTTIKATVHTLETHWIAASRRPG